MCIKYFELVLVDGNLESFFSVLLQCLLNYTALYNMKLPAQEKNLRNKSLFTSYNAILLVFKFTFLLWTLIHTNLAHT